MNKKVLVWLEDRQDYNQEIEAILKESPFELNICQDLNDFKKTLDSKKTNPETIAGFVMDILIPVDDLTELGLSTVKTSLGNDTGVQVLKYYLRNALNDSPMDNIWKKHDVLVLTTLSESYIKSNYKSFMTWEKENNHNTSWLVKADEEGIRDTCLKATSKWLKRL